jgi:hypothetical protein
LIRDEHEPGALAHAPLWRCPIRTAWRDEFRAEERLQDRCEDPNLLERQLQPVFCVNLIET